jgi:tetratricopeptide (TPR) repeat protein
MLPLRPSAIAIAFAATMSSAALGQGPEDQKLCNLEKMVSDRLRRSTEPEGTGLDSVDATISSCTRMIDGGGMAGRDLVWLYLTRSVAHRYKNDFRLSIADATKAIEIDPSDDWAYSFRGGAYVEIAEYDRAIDDFTKLIGLGHSQQGYMARADAYSKKGEHDRAIADATKVIEMNPKEPSTYTARARHHLRAGKAASALEDVNRATEMRARAWHHELYIRAQAFEALGRREEAIADYRHALRLAEGHKAYQDALRRLGVEP